MQEYWITEVHKGAHKQITKVIAHEDNRGPSLVNRREFSIGEVVEKMLHGDKFFIAKRKAGQHGGFQKCATVEYELTTAGVHKNVALESLPEY
jgi:hypothetical protein